MPTHGSLTKAGKVREMTKRRSPRVPQEKKPRKGPRLNNKRRWYKMLVGKSHLGKKADERRR